jgi:hypothetical protein
MRSSSKTLGIGWCTAFLALSLASCTDSPTSPGLIAKARTRANDDAGGKPPRVSNAVKYSDKGANPVTGRSGSASLTTRALLGKDGVTLVEISTGALDGTNALGKLEKVQNKLFGTSGDLLLTTNYNHLSIGSYASYTYSSLARNSNVQIQANVTGIDPSRTDVVTVTSPVKLRPDPAVNSLNFPANAHVGDIVVISAAVAEKNGDVGARADCVLYVDGAEADRNDGIWVDAGGNVTCLFAQQFSTAGTRQLRVALSNVVPGDYDATNNEQVGSIEVVEPNVPMYWNSYAYRADYTDQWANEYHYDYPDNSRWIEYDSGDQDVHYGSYTLYAYAYEPIAFPIGSVDISIATDGTNWHSQSLTNVAADNTVGDETNGAACASWYTDESFTWTYLCSYHGTYGSFASFQVNRYDEQVTYASLSYYRYFDASGQAWEGYYYYNPPTTYTYGSGLEGIPPVGNESSFNLRMESAGTVFTASGSMQFTTQSLDFTSPLTCYPPSSYNGYYTWYPCYSQERRGQVAFSSGYGQ